MSERTNVVGIDPGLDGGIAIMPPSLPPTLHVMPTLELQRGRMLNAAAIREILLDANPCLVAVEVQQCYPKQGGKSNFTTGFGYGRLLGLLEGLEMTYCVVRPRVWQKAVGIVSSGKSKQQAARIALARWPKLCLLATPRCRVPHDGLADAALIGLWARTQLF